jgi:hypothetical protein
MQTRQKKNWRYEFSQLSSIFLLLESTSRFESSENKRAKETLLTAKQRRPLELGDRLSMPVRMPTDCYNMW